MKGRGLGEVAAQDELILRRGEWKRNGRRVVFVSGAFDLLHPGHVRLLEQARGLGDVVVVGVQSDAAVRAAAAESSAQGTARPIYPAAERAEILAALAAVDCVVEFDAISPAKLITQLAPDVVVEGADLAQASPESTDSPTGPKFVRIPLEPGYSTGRLLDRIKRLGHLGAQGEQGQPKQAGPLGPRR